MKTKIIEIRDRGTKIITIATQVNPNETYSEFENKHLRHAGFGWDNPMVFLCRMDNNRGTYDPFNWDNLRIVEAHRYIEKNFDKIANGWVVDIEYILGETSIMKVPEILYKYPDNIVNFSINPEIIPDEYIDLLRGTIVINIVKDDPEKGTYIFTTTDQVGLLGDKIYDYINNGWLVPIIPR